MRLQREDLEPTKVKIQIYADGEDLEPIKLHVLSHFRHKVKIPGFRAGMAPLAIVEKHVNQKELHDEFLGHAMNQLYSTAIRQEKLRPVGQPNVQLKKFVPFSELELEVETDAIGAVVLPDYKKIKLQKTPVKVETKEVNEVLKSLQKQSAERKNIERPAKEGDEVVIDFVGKDKQSQLIAGAEGKDYPLMLGSGNFIPGFEEKLIGQKSGSKKSFKIKFPADYHAAALQSKEVTFDVDIKQVNQLSLAKADDNLAAKVGPFKTLAELKADIKKNLKIENQQRADRDFENRLIGELVSKSKIELPKSMVDEDIARLEDEEKRTLLQRGQTWQEHLAEEGITEAEHQEKQRPRAEERLKAGIILGEISDKEGIQITPEEINERIKLLKGQYQDDAMQAELDKPDARREVESRLLTEKTIGKLVDDNKN